MNSTILTAVSTPITRKVTYYNIVSGVRKAITTTASTWGELERQLEATHDMSKCKVIEAASRLSFVDKDTALPTNILTSSGEPTNDLLITVTPTKNINSGMALSHKECRETIKDIIAKNPSAKDFFNKNKNYTNKGTDELNLLISNYSKKSTSKKEVVSKKVDVKAVKPVTSSKSSTVLKKVQENCKTGNFSQAAEQASSTFTPSDAILTGVKEILQGINTLQNAGLFSLVVTANYDKLTNDDIKRMIK